MTTKTFSDVDCMMYPTEVQEAILANHEDLGGEIDGVMYMRDGITVLLHLEGQDDWIAIAPKK